LSRPNLATTATSPLIRAPCPLISAHSRQALTRGPHSSGLSPTSGCWTRCRARFRLGSRWSSPTFDSVARACTDPTQPLLPRVSRCLSHPVNPIRVLKRNRTRHPHRGLSGASWYNHLPDISALDRAWNISPKRTRRRCCVPTQAWPPPSNVLEERERVKRRELARRRGHWRQSPRFTSSPWFPGQHRRVQPTGGAVLAIGGRGRPSGAPEFLVDDFGAVVKPSAP
jgi:hypothetical protein